MVKRNFWFSCFFFLKIIRLVLENIVVNIFEIVVLKLMEVNWFMMF